jgi:phosphate transport system protein
MRNAYFDQLDTIVEDLVAMTDDVQVAVARATRALLSADAEVAERVISDDVDIDAARERVEQKAFDLLALQQPVAKDLRMLVAALRMVADLERMGDLAVHIAKVARMRLPDGAVPESLQPTMERMAAIAVRMVDANATIVADRDVDAALGLEDEDDEMDQLRRSLFRILLSDDWAYGVEPAIDLALLGRYYERIGDHAVSMGKRVVYFVTGEAPVSVDTP